MQNTLKWGGVDALPIQNDYICIVRESPGPWRWGGFSLM